MHCFTKKNCYLFWNRPESCVQYFILFKSNIDEIYATMLMSFGEDSACIINSEALLAFLRIPKGWRYAWLENLA